jgi:hypothetical protein
MEKGLVMDVNYRKSRDNGASWPFDVYPSNVQPEISSSGTINSKKYGDWYFVQLPVPAKKDISDAQWNAGYQYAVVWVGCPNGNGAGGSAIVYVDDIRFYPKDAMVTSTYYDQKWYQPILSIDANNNPGKKVEYDDFGRPVRWYKINNKNPFDVTLLQEKEYRLMMQVNQLLYENHFEPDEQLGFTPAGNVLTRESGGVGPGTQQCLRIDCAGAIYPKLYLDDTKLTRRLCTITGYYKSPGKETSLHLACGIPHPSPNVPLILPATNDWIQFSYEVDLTEWDVTACELRVGTRTMGTAWIDELKVLTN